MHISYISCSGSPCIYGVIDGPKVEVREIVREVEVREIVREVEVREIVREKGSEGVS